MHFRISFLMLILTSVLSTAAFAGMAVDDQYGTGQGTILTVPASQGLLANDFGAGISVTGYTQPTGPLLGVNFVNVNPDGSFDFHPDPSSGSGVDSFTYTITGGSMATVMLNVHGSNSNPVAADDFYTTPKGVALNVPTQFGVLKNDSDPDWDLLSTSQFSSTTNGTLSLNADGSFDYTPNPAFRGIDSFAYAANDGSLTSGLANVSITVDTPPVASPENYSTPNATVLNVPAINGLLINDTDADGDSLQAFLLTPPGNGTVGINTDGSFTYTPTGTFSGDDTFTYKAYDGLKPSASTPVTITVAPASAPSISSFTAAPAFVRSGGSATLSWSTTNATAVTIAPGIGAVALTGSIDVNPTVTTTYTLTASSAGGSVTASTIVEVLNVSLTPSSASIERLAVTSFSVKLSTAQPADVRVALASSDPAVASIPPEVVIPAGQLSRNITVQGLIAGTTQLSALLPAELGDSAATSSLTVTPLPAQVVATAFPSVLTETAADGSAASTTFTVSNIGDVAASVSVAATTGGVTFYSVSPTNFSIPGNSSQVITVTALPQSLPGSFSGSAIVTVSGVTVASLPIQLLAFAPQGLGVPNVVPVTTRIDLAAPDGTNPSGILTYRNDGSTRATGVVAPDVPWIITAPGVVAIDPGKTADVPFQIDRSKQPPTATSGSIQGNTTFVYQAGSTGEKLLESSPALSLVVPISDTRQPQTSAGGVPPLGPGEIALIVPGIGHVTGSGGKEFISDVSIVNTQSFFGIPDMRLYYSSNGNTVSALQLVTPNQALQLADAVNTYFRQGTSSQGTLHVRSADTSKLSVNANVFNKADPKGTYGSAIPVFRSDRTIGPGETGVLTGLRKDNTIHTNLYLQEMAAGTASARIDFYDANGLRVGGVDSQLGVFGFNALGPVVPNAAVMATVSNSGGSGRLQAYATPVDDASGDTWAVADWNRKNALVGNEATMIPVAGFVPGANGANFRTDLAVTNVGSAAGSINLTYYPSGAPAVTKTITLNRNQTSVASDVTESLFAIPGTSVGWIALAPQTNGRFAVTSRTYTASAEPGTFGTGVPTLALDKALTRGQSQIFGGIEDTNIKTQNNRSGNTFRTNLGLVETSGTAVTVKVSVSFPNGTSLASGTNGTKTIDLTPHQFLQLNGIVRQIIGPSRDTNYGDLHNVQVKIEVTNGTGAVMPFVTSTDNGTNDTVLRTE